MGATGETRITEQAEAAPADPRSARLRLPDAEIAVAPATCSGMRERGGMEIVALGVSI